jgi:hypothetical protein
MQCQGEGCQEPAVTHVTEIIGGEPTHLHLCQRHTDEYQARDAPLPDHLHKAAAIGGCRKPVAAADSVPSLIRWAVKCYGGLTAEEAIPQLVGLLGDENAGVRWAAVVTLGRIGRGSAAAAAGLRAALSDGDDEVREAATWALSQVERTPPDGAEPDRGSV